MLRIFSYFVAEHHLVGLFSDWLFTSTPASCRCVLKCSHSGTHASPLGVDVPVSCHVVQQSAGSLTCRTGCVWDRDGLRRPHTHSQSISPDELNCSGPGQSRRASIINTASPGEGGRAPWQLEDEQYGCWWKGSLKLSSVFNAQAGSPRGQRHARGRATGRADL